MEEAKGNPRIFTRRKTTWASKPRHLYSGKTFEMEGYVIPIEHETEARRNFDRFKRDIMAIPSLALEPYLRQWALVEKAIDVNVVNPFDSSGRLMEWFKTKQLTPHYMHIDLSLTTDATGLAMCCMQDGVVYIRYLKRIKARKGEEIDLSEVRAEVYELKARGFQIQKCTYDQFQSASSIQEFNRMGINAERLSVDKDLSCYETLKEGFYQGKIKMYSGPDLMMDLRRLELVKGRKVDHPANGSKDLADAAAGAVYNCVKHQNNFMAWVGGANKGKTPEEVKKEAEVTTAEGLGVYGYMHGRRGMPRQ